MCFSLAWVEQICIWIVCIIAVVAIVRLLVPWLLSLVGGSLGPVPAIINIVLWAVVAIMVIYVIFALISCLFSGAMMLPHH
jgi:hypothetical protein